MREHYLNLRERLFDVVRAWSLSAGGFDVRGWNDFRALPVGWFEGLAAILARVEEPEVWTTHLLDAFVVAQLSNMFECVACCFQAAGYCQTSMIHLRYRVGEVF